MVALRAGHSEESGGGNGTCLRGKQSKERKAECLRPGVPKTGSLKKGIAEARDGGQVQSNLLMPL